MRIRSPKRVILAPSAYVALEPLDIPAYLDDLERIPGRCYSPYSGVICGTDQPGRICQECAMVELGETWQLFKARTNAAIPKAKFYRDLEAAQAADDPDFRRAFMGGQR